MMPPGVAAGTCLHYIQLHGADPAPAACAVGALLAATWPTAAIHAVA